MPSTTPGMPQHTPPAFRMPAEWTLHEACWVAWPWHPDWEDHLAAARAEFGGLIRAMVESDAAAVPERIELLVRNAADEADARTLLQVDAWKHPNAIRFHRAEYGDIWLRDTGAIFVRDAAGNLHALGFQFNGWGGKYVYAGDESVAKQMATLTGRPLVLQPWVLEGGGVEVDGEGTLLTTRQCMLSEARNPSMSEPALERALGDALGAERVIWLDEGLARDHTDGHIDTLARYVRPGVVACMEARSHDDPNRDVLRAIQRRLNDSVDAQGRKLELLNLPSPGRILDSQDRVMPASYCNFYIGNATVVVPTYGSVHDEEAVQRIAEAFPERRVVGSPAKTILEGGGAFHCITQQQPA